MNDQKLLTLFPEATMHKHPQAAETFYNFKLSTAWLAVPKKHITERELALLQATLPREEMTNDPASPWANFLSGHGDLPPSSAKTVRLLQINFAAPAPAESEQDVADIFEDVLDTFTNGNVLAVIQCADRPLLHADQLEAMKQTLEDDWGRPFKYYLGRTYPLSSELRTWWRNELDVFKQILKTGRAATTLPAATTALLAQADLFDMPLLTQLATDIQQDPGDVKAIRALWEAFGNVSEAAAQLFMHRNTLQYRLQKLEKHLQLNFRQADDLALAYFLTFQT